MSLARRRILLGVSGGIAAYKACILVRRLRDAGAEVRVAMTEGATHFVGTATFQALSGQPVHTDLWNSASHMGMDHIELARWAEDIVIAPASADCIARLTQGRADDLLTTVCLASAASLTLAPAMNWRMWRHPATQANIATLHGRGVTVLGPDEGPLAEGESGVGRMLEPEDIVAALEVARGTTARGPLAGKSIVVSAGPTLEDIDPVRYIGNRSSGRMGFAVAAAAVAAGANVTLVAGPVALPTPPGVARRINVRSAREMHEAVLDVATDSDMYIASAAVGDYRPRIASDCKLKKQAGALQTLELTENPDILMAVTALPKPPFVVGFAAETNDVEAYARDKLKRKKLDMIAANLVGAGVGFETEDNALTVYWSGGEKALPRADKRDLAEALLVCIGERYQAARGDKA
ncbi:MAG TPA: bifunctional phosphopantothenoylcysteine decarboxylase/phosphopantothenate--cysteine ligase CoaBC [Oleiagrimonas sp.]|nr:bifunctional phosphopantothenoylcysteine decarboxylase/phosphopantothenate--cysteine ligase CoaBC [Oleiagrimonas sp.]